MRRGRPRKGKVLYAIRLTFKPYLPAITLSKLPTGLTTPPGTLSLHLTKLQAFVMRCPSPVAVRTSFGIMRERPAVFVRAENADGAVGWGEIWCNFPACGAEHHVRLLDTVVAPWWHPC